MASFCSSTSVDKQFETLPGPILLSGTAMVLSETCKARDHCVSCSLKESADEMSNLLFVAKFTLIVRPLRERRNLESLITERSPEPDSTPLFTLLTLPIFDPGAAVKCRLFAEVNRRRLGGGLMEVADARRDRVRVGRWGMASRQLMVTTLMESVP
ncbi:hypothetical protein J6590_021163 [Homalodisca vitripennis]|nr:hypothetical protein J6590_021163 [Homalodisca vitripennis]